MSGEGSRLWSRSGGQGRGSRSWVKVRVIIGGHKVGGQARWSRSRYRSWGQVWGGVKVGGSGRGQGLGRGSRSGSRLWSRSRVNVRGHDRWSQGLGSMLGVDVRGVVKVMGRGSVSGGLGSDGWWGEVGDKQSVPFKNS